VSAAAPTCVDANTATTAAIVLGAATRRGSRAAGCLPARSRWTAARRRWRVADVISFRYASRATGVLALFLLTSSMC
jgi:hypothetical protein